MKIGVPSHFELWGVFIYQIPFVLQAMELELFTSVQLSSVNQLIQL